MAKRLIAEFEEQSFVQMVFPHPKSDWVEYLEEARENFVAIIDAIRKYERVVLVCSDVEEAKRYFKSEKNIDFIEYESDDTWARDISAISVCEDGKRVLYDFEFNAWGGKFAFAKDNALTKALSSFYNQPIRHFDFILEGGGIETNGKGVLLTTASCMLNPNRNNFDEATTTQKLKEFFGLDRVHYLRHGYLAGDDTDSHIDTLVRFVDERTIMYLCCEDREDEHYKELRAMEEELEVIAKEEDFDLIPLPFCDAIYFEGERLPATYANFLIINGAVLVPLYGVKQDAEALEIFRDFFKDRDVVGVDCSVLIRQHGSLHCVTMNF
ncbi:Agmatine deiminase [hydrothermal vent metagenome]|uniref:Agmatine deiminase n=1 Tax=hydrothermal vent metagenome TaxID=652676 RepID=A0A1W1C473_9ZZZZ